MDSRNEKLEIFLTILTDLEEQERHELDMHLYT